MVNQCCGWYSSKTLHTRSQCAHVHQLSVNCLMPTPAFKGGLRFLLSYTETLFLFSSHFNAVDDLWFHAEKHTECLHSHVYEEVCFPFVTRIHHLGVCLDDYLLTMRYWLWSGIASLYLCYGHNHEVFHNFFLIPQYLAKC